MAPAGAREKDAEPSPAGLRRQGGPAERISTRVTAEGPNREAFEASQRSTCEPTHVISNISAPRS
jgi:hypothetical protein